MACKCGIVGLPNVGKSTLYNALTRSAVAAENYPFCTIEPNIGVVAVPDPRLQQLAALLEPKRVLSATVEFVDIAGLVEGASKGEGLGNQFLAHIRETQAIIQTVRCFEDENVAHVAGRVDPVSDLETIATELCLADQETVDRALQKASKQAKSGDQDAGKRVELLQGLEAHLDQGLPVRLLPLSGGQQTQVLQELQLLSAKPMLYLANVAEADINSDSPALRRLCLRAEREGVTVLPICAALEMELAQLEEAEQREFLQDSGMDEPGLNRVIRAVYALLGLQTFFTAGEREVRAWTIRQGDSAVTAAGVIHSDFERGFIRAEVVSFVDYVACGSEQGAKAKGKWRSEGRDYIVADGDVVLFRFNV